MHEVQIFKCPKVFESKISLSTYHCSPACQFLFPENTTESNSRFHLSRKELLLLFPPPASLDVKETFSENVFNVPQENGLLSRSLGAKKRLQMSQVSKFRCPPLVALLDSP